MRPDKEMEPAAGLDQSLMLNGGALAAAIGLGAATWQLAFYNSAASSSSAPFFLVLIACVVVLVWARRGQNITRRVLRRTAALSIPVFLVCAMRAPLTDYALASYLAVMRSDLRGLAERERQVLADSGHYTGQVGGVEHSTGVTFDSITREGAGWAATARHRRTSQVCAIFVDQVPRRPASTPGEPACTLPPFPAMELGGTVALVVLGLALSAAGARSSAERAT